MKDFKRSWFEKVFTLSPIGMAMVDEEFRFIKVNQAYCRMMGYSEDELLMLTFRDITHPDYREDTTEKVVDLFQRKANLYQSEKQYIRKDGRVIWGILKLVIVSEKNEHQQYCLGMVEDITERKITEIALAENEKKLVQITDNVPVFISLVNKNLEYVFVNKGYEEFFHLKKEEIIGKKPQDILDKRGYERAYPFIMKALAGTRCDFENRLITSDGKEHVIQTVYTPYYQNNAIEGIITLVIDITERRRLDESIIRSEMEHRSTLNALPEWIFLVDEQLILIMCNDPLKALFHHYGFPEDCTGMKVTSDCPFISARSITQIRKVFRTGMILISEERLRQGDRVLFCEVWRIPVIADRKVIKVICVIRDRSKEREIEALKEKSAKEKDVLLREIHHRVKNNLAVISGLFDFQVRNTKNEELITLIKDLQLRIRSIALIHTHLYQSERFDRIPLSTYIESLIQIICSTFGKDFIEFETRLDPVDVSIEKALPIGLIINELITNSVKFAFPDGKPGKIMVGLVRKGRDKCILEVSDNGVGIPADYSLESSKTMGFYIIRILTMQLEGKMKLDRTHGSSFILHFRNI